MEKKQALVIMLSQEELMVILHYLQVQELPGFDRSVFEGLSEQELKRIMAIAERSLIARQFFLIDQDQMTLHDAVYAMVAACAMPDESIVLSFQYADANQVSHVQFFHAARNMVVHHSSPITGIHQFIALKDRKSMQTSIISLLEVNKYGKEKDLSGTISDRVISAAREMIQQDKPLTEVIPFLVDNSELDEPVAEAFVNTIKNAVINHTLIHFTREQQGDTLEKGFSILADQETLWLLVPMEELAENEHLVSIETINGNDLLDYLKNLTSIA
jgi:hypothetical protein